MHVKGKEKIVAALDIGYKICQLDLYKKKEASILGNIYIGKVRLLLKLKMELYVIIP